MKKLSVSIIGPFPEPIHGMSISNELLLNYFSGFNDISISYFDITLNRKLKSKDFQGKFDIYIFLLSLCNVLKLFLFIMKKRSDVFYITPPQSSLGYIRIVPAIILAKIIGSKIVIHIHGSRFNYYLERTTPIIRFLIKKSLNLADGFILLGESIQKSHQKLFEKKKVFICENGVEEPNIDVSLRKKESVNVLFLSNLMKEKGVFDFLDAIERIQPNEHYHFDIAGALEPSCEGQIKKRLEELGENVSYHGVVRGKDKETLFNKAHIFVLPSYDEGQPLSILEAYSYGCTVVTTNVGGISDIFSDNVNGKYVNVNDSKSIADTLVGISRSDLAFFSRNNRASFLQKFTQEAFAKRILDILQKI